MMLEPIALSVEQYATVLFCGNFVEGGHIASK